jgi:O-antigen ligase
VKKVDTSNKSNRFAYLLSITLFTSLGFGAFNYQTIFSIKPYMVVVLLIALYLLYKRPVSFRQLIIHEYLFLYFLLLVMVSIAFSLYPFQTLRYVLGATMLIFSYFVLRTFYSKYLSIRDINKTIAIAGIIVGISSLIYYVFGMVAANFVFNGNGIEVYGLMIDRNYPRLMGTAANDPNLAVLYLSLFFLFFLVQKKYLLMKVLYLLLIILTLSRGALISIMATIIIYYILTNKRVVNLSQIRTIVIILVSIVIMGGIFSVYAKINIADSIIGRFQTASDDGGSGRTDQWLGAATTYYQYPITGIGANSSLEYNSKTYDGDNYSHNTYLDALSELGIVGITVFITSIIFTLRCAYASFKKTGGFSLILFIGIITQMTFLSIMVNEMYLVGVLIVFLYSLPSTNYSKNQFIAGMK